MLVVRAAGLRETRARRLAELVHARRVLAVLGERGGGPSERGAFVLLVGLIKRLTFPAAPLSETCEVERRWACGPRARGVLVKTAIGACVGGVSLFLPPTPFWGELSAVTLLQLAQQFLSTQLSALRQPTQLRSPLPNQCFSSAALGAPALQPC